MKAWLFTLAENQKYWGNQGYENTPASSYSYDNFVANYKRVAIGDLVIERLGKKIVGVSVIDEISVRRGTKDIFRCPTCGNSRLRKRKTVSPEWICEKGHEFPSPVTDTRQSIQCKAEYAAGYLELDEAVESNLIEPALVSGNRMFAIQEVALKILFAEKSDKLTRLISQLRALADYDENTSNFSPSVRDYSGLSEPSESTFLQDESNRFLIGPHVLEAEALGKLKAYLAGCCAEDDMSDASHNKARLPVSSKEFDQLRAEVDAASALLVAPQIEPTRLTPLIQLLERVKGYLDIFISSAASSMGKAMGVIAVGTAADLAGLLDEIITMLRILFS